MKNHTRIDSKIFVLAIISLLSSGKSLAKKADSHPASRAQSSSTTKRWDAKMFKKPSDEELKKKLSTTQYNVTQEEATERAFNNEFNDNKRQGIYVDIVSGEPLFSSNDKYDSGSGWPSFSERLVAENLTTKTDRKLFSTRTEVRSKHADSHLGHVFNDGPKPTGLRYCINSAALRFIPVDELEKEGYGNFLASFDQKENSSKPAAVKE